MGGRSPTGRNLPPPSPHTHPGSKSWIQEGNFGDQMKKKKGLRDQNHKCGMSNQVRLREREKEECERVCVYICKEREIKPILPFKLLYTFKMHRKI